MSEKYTFEIIDAISKKISEDAITKDLDENQRKAVTCEQKDAICVSIAGSGKTRILTRRVAYLINNMGINEEDIILLTFTNKAANEMLERVKSILEKEDLKILGGTFHHVATVFLRKYANKIDFGKNFTILTPDDCKSLIGIIRDEYLEEIGVAKSEFPSAKVIYQLNSTAINTDVDVEYICEDYRFSPSIYTHIKFMLARYKDRKKDSNSMDFDDLIVKFNELLDDDDIRDEITGQYSHILVDEYQDINHIQYEIIEKLNGDNHNLFVCGDKNQSIYGFRGGKVEFIEAFQHTHDCNTFIVNKNYRSNGHILKLAENCINNNYQEIPVVMDPVKAYEKRPIVYELKHEIIQADFISTQIKSLMSSGVDPREIAILVRGTFLTTKPLETAFRKHGIPYVMKAGFSYYERRHIKDLVAFLTLIENPLSEDSFKRTLRLFNGIGVKTVNKIYNHYISVGNDYKVLLDDVNSNKLKLSAKAKDNALKYLELINKLMSQKSISSMLQLIINDFYDDYLKNSDEDYSERIQEISFLVIISKEYNSLNKFLEEITLDMSETEAPEEGQKKPDKCVTISTIHRAKGLEWDYVFLPYMNNNLFPSKKVMESLSDEDIEEERRLMYVATTRAKKELIMSYVNYINICRQYFSSSKFIKELNPKLYDKKIIRVR